MGTPRRGLSALAFFATATVALTTFASGCFNGNVGEPGTSCQSTRTYFLNEVWGPVMGRTCVNCHSPGGTARLQGARFELLPASYPDFVETNLRNIQQMAGYSYNNTSLILAKPMGLTTHGGGTIFTPGSSEYNAINGLLSRLNAGANNDSCPDYGSVATPSGVQVLDWPQTLRRVSLDLLGRLPTDAETAAAQDETGFSTVLESGLGASAAAGSTQAGYLNEEAFYQRMRTAWNDLLLTDRYVSGDGCDQRALNMIPNRDFPNRGTYGGGATAGLDCCGMDRDNPMCSTVRDFFLQANNAVAQEPINLIDHVIRTNRPFTEILTANYVMVNPQSAHVYGIDDQVPGGNIYGDANSLFEGRVHYNRYVSDTETESVDFPHAGVLTTAAFLNRYPTTVTNRNRHRARMVQSFFLATDILKVGERPIDATASEALVMTPTMNYGPCVTCHRLNDPIAGSFRGFYDRNTGAQWRFDPHDAWYTDMFPPGYAGENMPGAEYPRALQWLAPRLAQDQRFASSVVRFVYTALTGRQPLVYPTDTTDTQAYADQSAAWIEQDRVFRAVAQRFIAANLNFKTVVLELVKSPLYRAVAIPLPADATPDQIASQSARHIGIGSSRMLTPEILDRRVTAIAGFTWARDRSRPADSHSWLEEDFYFPYGGINSDTIIRRPNDPSGVIVNIAQRMATEVACRGTAWDFTRPTAERRFFRGVELNTVPESAGNTVPASVTAIRANIVQLHQLILGETLSPSDPEVDRTYNLFLDTWHEVTTPPMGMTMPDTDIPYECQARVDLTTGDAIPDMQQINNDRNHPSVAGGTHVPLLGLPVHLSVSRGGMTMDRRHFLGLSVLAGLTAGISPALHRRLFAQSMTTPDDALQPYTDKFFIFVNAGGGWDPTMVCDPKGGDVNTDAFTTADIQTVGAFKVAPVTYTVDGNDYSNQAFFTKFQDRLLVMNGVDMNTNNHDTGTRFTWTGHLEDGYPPLAAIVAAALAPGKPLAFLSNGGYEYTAGIAPLTRLNSIDTIGRIAFPNRPDPNNEDSRYMSDATYTRIRQYQHDRLAALSTRQTLPIFQQTMRQLQATRGGSNLLERLIASLPPRSELDAARNIPLLYQGMIALAAYQAGITAAVNLSIGGFDTHSDHNRNQTSALGQLMYGVDRLMDRVDALNLRDKVVLVVGSDFGRTPQYNEGRGKDHWSVTSVLAMGAGIRGGRVVGGSTDGDATRAFRARNLDTASLMPVDGGNVKLNPKQIHLALRRLAGVDSAPVAREFPIVAEDLNLFG